jgi:hypothetical protein
LNGSWMVLIRLRVYNVVENGLVNQAIYHRTFSLSLSFPSPFLPFLHFVRFVLSFKKWETTEMNEKEQRAEGKELME